MKYARLFRLLDSGQHDLGQDHHLIDLERGRTSPKPLFPHRACGLKSRTLWEEAARACYGPRRGRRLLYESCAA